jgi:hypothetical protein
MSRTRWLGCAASLLIAASATAAFAAQSAPGGWPPLRTEPWPQGALSRENLAKPRPPAPFDMTGNWMPINEPANGGLSQFRPLPVLKPPAQELYDAGRKANAAGLAFRDDAGKCWPNGMPKFLNRAWPIQMFQYPTVVVMIQELENQIRWIYTDGRGHGDPDLVPATWHGDSIARWEGDTLLVDTSNIESKRHWIETGIPVSDQFHIVERWKMLPTGILEVKLEMTDPVMWEGVWASEKHYRRVEDRDLTEVHCPPDVNDHIAGTRSSE